MQTSAEIEAALPELSSDELDSLILKAEAIRTERTRRESIEERIAAFDALSASLALDDDKVRLWQETVREGRP